jgi:hypothetical protein
VTLSSTEGQEFLTSTISFLYSHYNVTSIWHLFFFVIL